MEATSDALLATAARDGDHAAYGELFGRYQSRIYNYAYGIAGNREDAADIAQEAFVRVFEALPRLTGELNFSAYVYRTTHNIAIDTVKGRARFDAPEALELQAEPSLRADPERVALVQQQQAQAWQAAFRLSDDHRAILTLRELHDLSYQEIAEIMDMPRNTVGVLLSRARLKFKEAFRMSSIDIDKLTAECRDMLPLLSAYIDDELNDKKRTQVESHLEQCAFCRLALEEMTESSRSYRAILPLLPPAALGEGLWQRLGDLGQPGGQNSVSQPDSISGTGEGVDGSTSAADPAGGATNAAGATGGAAEPTEAAPSTDPSVPVAARPKSGPTHPIPRLAAFIAGGVVVIAVVTLFATGIFGSGGSSADDVPAAVLTEVDGTAQSDLGGTGTTSLSETTVPSGSTTTLAEATMPSSAITTVTTPGTITTTVGQGVNDPAAGGTPGGVAPDTSATTAPRPPDTDAPPTPGIIYPAGGETVKGSSLTLRWKPVRDPSGTTYRVEVQSLDSKAGEYATTRRVEGIKTDELTHTMSSTVERWRVTAVDGAGNMSKPSVWAKFAQAVAGVPSTKPTLTTVTLPDLPLTIPTLPLDTTTSTAVLY